MSVKPKVVNGFSWTFVCKMGAGPSTNLYSIGGGPLTQLNFNYNFYFLFLFFIRNAVVIHMYGMPPNIALRNRPQNQSDTAH